MPVAAEEHGARVVGRYILFGEIAAGGMATVHFGRLNGPVGFSRTVAIKRLHPQFAKDPEFVTMFLDEARLAGRIRHPNVVPTLDVVATEGEIFLVMEYVQGESLSRLSRALRARNASIPRDVAVTILAGTLHGLHAAHEAKDEHGAPLHIVPRDVSPQNILVGTDGVARVLDFGVAKAAGRLQTTRDGQLKGKIAYMAPEQLHTGNVARQTDIYAAAVVLWETLAGRRLFEGDNEAMVLVKAIEGKVPLLGSIVAGIPSSFDEVIARGLAKDASDRWATAREMAIALERCGRMASPSEVGEWVETVATDELMKRAARVAEIESVSSQYSAKHVEALFAEATQAQARGDDGLPSSKSFSAVVPVRIAGAPQSTRELDSQLSSISVTRSGASSTRSTRARLGVAALLALLVSIAVIAAFIVALRRGHETALPPVAAVPAPPPPAVDVPPSVDEPPAQADPPAATAKLAPPPAPPPKPVVRSPPRPAAPSPPKPSCDPPFTIDAAGHKKYKMECMTK